MRTDFPSPLLPLPPFSSNNSCSAHAGKPGLATASQSILRRGVCGDEKRLCCPPWLADVLIQRNLDAQFLTPFTRKGGIVGVPSNTVDRRHQPSVLSFLFGEELQPSAVQHSVLPLAWKRRQPATSPRCVSPTWRDVASAAADQYMYMPRSTHETKLLGEYYRAMACTT